MKKLLLIIAMSIAMLSAGNSLYADSKYADNKAFYTTEKMYTVEQAGVMMTQSYIKGVQAGIRTTSKAYETENKAVLTEMPVLDMALDYAAGILTDDQKLQSEIKKLIRKKIGG